jgi:hypothetical protein
MLKLFSVERQHPCKRRDPYVSSLVFTIQFGVQSILQIELMSEIWNL